MDLVPPELKSQFIDDHVAIALRRNPRSLGETAVRLGSVAMRDILAGRAVTPVVDFRGLLELLDSGMLGRDDCTVDEWGLAEVARVIALQRLEPEDLPWALRLYEHLLATGTQPLDLRHRGMYLHLKAELEPTGRRRARLPKGHPAAHAALVSMLECNRLHRSGTPRRAWLRELGRLLGTDCALRPGDGPALDRLEAAARQPDTAADLVSVIIPVASGEDPLPALRSVLRQSHTETELLVTTAAPLCEEVTAVVAAVPGARVLECDGASYGELVNHALRVARGGHLLVLAPSDWCAPQLAAVHLRRIKRRGDPAVAARTARLRADSDLRLGPFGVHAPEQLAKTLMFKRSVVDDIGYFHAVGPEALEEYAKRIRAAYGKGSVSVSRAKVLALTPDERRFVPHLESEEGETAPWFPGYSSSYTRWHRRCIDAGERPYLPFAPESRPFPLPLAMRPVVPGAPRRRFDLVFASDWRPFGGPAKSMMEEIAAARRLGLHIGVMNLEAVRMMAPMTRPVCGPVQRLIDAGEVELVQPCDEVDIDTLVVRYPLVLQFDRRLDVACDVRRLVIHANQPPCEADGSDLRYFVRDCEVNAERWFRVEPSWAPQGPQARKALLEAPVPPRRLEPFDLPGILDPSQWEVRRDGYRSDIPVLGRHSRDHLTKWPADAETLLSVYPDDSGYDFRNMGGAFIPAEVLGGTLPRNWIAYGYDETDVKDFLYQLDFWVYFPNEIRVEAFGRAILEAMASGCVVTLPWVFESTFGEGALYCTAGEVRNLVDKYRSDLGAYLEQSRRGQRYVREHFSHGWYQRLIGAEFLKPNAIPGPMPRPA
jgi:O-antigen biosynthesis protein